MGRRITRAKAKIKVARIPYRVPSAEDLPARVSGVLAVLFLVFNEGYLASGPDTDPVREDLTAEAIRLTRLVRGLLPDDGEVTGLLALMLLTEARRTARVSASGELVALGEQDRGVWDPALVAEGHRLVRERLAASAAGVAPGRYQILAAINAVHTSACDIRDTDWSQVVASTTSSSASTRRRSSCSTGPSRSPSSTARTWHWQPLTVSTTRWPATTPTTRLAPTCCAGLAAVTSPRGVRQSHRAGGQHRRGRLLDPPSRPAGVAGVQPPVVSGGGVGATSSARCCSESGRCSGPNGGKSRYSRMFRRGPSRCRRSQHVRRVRQEDANSLAAGTPTASVAFTLSWSTVRPLGSLARVRGT